MTDECGLEPAARCVPKRLASSPVIRIFDENGGLMRREVRPCAFCSRPGELPEHVYPLHYARCSYSRCEGGIWPDVGLPVRLGSKEPKKFAHSGRRAGGAEQDRNGAAQGG